jgi:hypothetical protein
VADATPVARIPTAGDEFMGWPPRAWLAAFRARPVVLASPHPSGDCSRRLAAVTTARGFTTWHLDPRTVGCPEPQLKGSVSGPRVVVAGYEDASGRNSFAAWLDARLQPSAVGAPRSPARSACVRPHGHPGDLRGVGAYDPDRARRRDRLAVRRSSQQFAACPDHPARHAGFRGRPRSRWPAVAAAGNPQAYRRGQQTPRLDPHRR